MSDKKEQKGAVVYRFPDWFWTGDHSTSDNTSQPKEAAETESETIEEKEDFNGFNFCEKAEAVQTLLENLNVFIESLSQVVYLYGNNEERESWQDFESKFKQAVERFFIFYFNSD